MDREVNKDCDLDIGKEEGGDRMIVPNEKESRSHGICSTKGTGGHSDSTANHSAKIRERNERVKQWLWRYREAKKDIRRLEEELRELMESQESASAIGYSDMPKGSLEQSDLSDYLVEREKVWRKIQKARYKRIMVFQEIKSAIDRLPSADERMVMSCRYLELNGYKEKSWEEICVITGHEWRQTHYIHSKALNNIEKIRNNT